MGTLTKTMASSGRAAAVFGAIAGFAVVSGTGSAPSIPDVWGPSAGGYDGKQTCAEMLVNVSCADPCVMHLGMEDVSYAVTALNTGASAGLRYFPFFFHLFLLFLSFFSHPLLLWDFGILKMMTAVCVESESFLQLAA